MRRFLAVLMALSVILTLCACSGSNTEKRRKCGLYVTVEATDVYTVSFGTDSGSESCTPAKGDTFKSGEVVHFDPAGTHAEKKASYVIDYTVCVYDKDMEILAVASFSDDFGNMAKINITVTEDHHIVYSGESVSCGGSVIVDINDSAPEAGITVAVPTVYIADRQDAAQKINDAVAQLNTVFLGSEKDAYRSAYDSNVAAATADAQISDFTMGRTVRTMRGDEKLISFRMVDRASLATDSSLKIFGATYDAETGEELLFDDLSSDSDALRSFCSEYVLIATTNEERFKDEGMVFNTGYTETLSSLVSDGHWYLSGEGLVIAANPGEIAPKESGFFEFVIPYSEIDDLLYERFLPEEYSGDYGNVSALSKAAADAGSFIAVGSDIEGATLSLTVTGNVYDLSVYTANYYNDGSYVLVSQLRYCSDMTRGGAFPIAAQLGATPGLYVGFTTADGQRHNRLIALDSAGNPVVYDPDGGDAGLKISSGYVGDLDGSGRSASVKFDSGKLTVSLGKKSFEAETPVASKESILLYDIDGDSAFEIFVSGKDENGADVSCGYDFSDELTALFEAPGSIGEFNGSRVMISGSFGFVGEFTVFTPYAITRNESGTAALTPSAGACTFAEGSELKLVIDLNVDGVISKAGTSLRLVSTDLATYIDCINSDGTAFRLPIGTAADGSWVVASHPASSVFSK